MVRKVPRAVFHPVPNVESALVSIVRTGPSASPAVSALVHAAFAHRRKTLAGSLALAPDAPAGIRARRARRARANWATPPTPAPSAWRRPTSSAWPTQLAA